MAGEHVGRSLIELLWEQMDAQYAKLMDREKSWNKGAIADLLKDGKASPKVREKYAADIVEHLQLQGKLQGLAYSIAKITRPYEDVKETMDEIKREAEERYEAEYGFEEDEEDAEDDEEDV